VDSFLTTPPEAEVLLALDVARDLASVLGHAEVRVEHVALALCADPEVALALERTGARLELVEASLEEALARVPSRPLATDEERNLDFLAQSVWRRAAAERGGLDRLVLLARLLVESPACSAIGVRPEALLANNKQPSATKREGAYREAAAAKGWTLVLTDRGDTTRSSISATARSLGLSRASASRAAVGAAAGVMLGLFSEADAKEVARTATARIERPTLTVEARELATTLLRDTDRDRVRRWWTKVQILRSIAAVAALVTVGLAWREANAVASTSVPQLWDETPRWVRLDGTAIPGHPRWLLSEGLPFEADPRKERPVSTIYDVDERGLVGYRVRIQIGMARMGVDPPKCTFEAPRDIPGPIASRQKATKFRFFTSPNGNYHTLVVGDADLSGPVAGTVRTLSEAGAPIGTLLYDHCKITDTVRAVLDTDPLPSGTPTPWVPICPNSNVNDRNCTPGFWGAVDANAPKGVAEWGVDTFHTATFEGTLGILRDQRLATQTIHGSSTSVRTLTLGPAPPYSVKRFTLPAAALLVAVLLALIARAARARGRPAIEGA
jgi:hypothetical protein